MNEMKFEFLEEKEERHKAKIQALGVGGAGGNAIQNMLASSFDGVDFLVANTDCQDLERSACSHKIQLGPSVTMGLGSGADPDVGRESAEESIAEIRDVVEGFDMVFLAAGMGGGTGTGATPVIARQCKEAGALTVAVVTKPFKFEGQKRMKKALQGLEELKREVDTLIVIPNERLKSVGSRNSTLKELFGRADDVLIQAVRGISDLILSNGFINLDFADVKKVMAEMGTAIMGTGCASGENRASEAAQLAVNSPLLEGVSIEGARGLLMNITGPSNMSMDEIDEASNYIMESVHEDADIFWGVVYDDNMEEEIKVTVIATGIDGDYPASRATQPRDYREYKEYSNVVNLRDVTPEEAEEGWTVRMNGETLDDLDIPTFQRKSGAAAGPAMKEDNKGGRKGLLSRFQFKNNLDVPTFLRAKAD